MDKPSRRNANDVELQGGLPDVDLPTKEDTSMTEKIRILFLSSNPWTTSRILVDEEAREIFEKLQEGPARDRFELHRHAAIRPVDLQRLLMMHEPHIVHFSGHGSKQHKIILGGKPGRGKQVDRDGLVKVFALYKKHVRLVVLNACFTKTQAKSLSEVIDYSVGAGKGIGDKEGVAFAGAFYRALGFGKAVTAAFESAKAELALTRMPRTRGLGLYVRKGVNENDAFPKFDNRAGKNTRARRRRIVSPVTKTPQTYNAALRNSSPRGKRVSAGSKTMIQAVTNEAPELFEQEAEICKHGHSLHAQTHKSARELTRQCDVTRPAATRGRKPKDMTCIDSIVESFERRVSRCCSCAYVTLSVTVFKVAQKFD